MGLDVVIPKKDLSKLLERCHGVADKKSAVPALASVLLTGEVRCLRVAADTHTPSLALCRGAAHPIYLQVDHTRVGTQPRTPAHLGLLRRRTAQRRAHDRERQA